MPSSLDAVSSGWSVSAVWQWMTGNHRHLSGGWFAAVLLTLMSSQGWAAGYSGIVESVAPASNSITIKIVSTGKTMVFKLSPTAKVMILGKAGALDGIEVGQIASITTVGTTNEATRVTVRAAPDAAPATTPKPTPKPKTGKTTKPAVAANQGDVAPGDWPQYRGPNRDNISAETGLLDQWPESGPEVVYTSRGLGEGYSEVSLVGGQIFTMGTRGQDEMLFALERETGDIQWSIRTGLNRQDGTGNGPRGTPTVNGDRVYALGANGDLVCAKIADGEIVWQLNILQTFQGNNIVWGISESVLIDGEKLICTPGGQQGTMVALDKRTGKPVWRSVVQGAPQAGYASPIAIDVGGVRQYVNFVHTGVVGVRATDGEPLWGQRASANDTANCSAPLAVDNVVFTASGYGTGSALFRLASRNNSTQSEVVYASKEMQNHHGGMVLLDGYVYGFDDAILTCLNLRTGKPEWQNRSVGKGSVTFADGKLFLRSEEGPLAMARATPSGYEERGRFSPPNRSGRPAWAHPVIAGGRMYIRDQETLTVFKVKP
jgi:outer membrane protein assembly factor BamB